MIKNQWFPWILGTYHLKMKTIFFFNVMIVLSCLFPLLSKAWIHQEAHLALPKELFSPNWWLKPDWLLLLNGSLVYMCSHFLSQFNLFKITLLIVTLLFFLIYFFSYWSNIYSYLNLWILPRYKLQDTSGLFIFVVVRLLSQLCLILCNPMNCSTRSFPVLHCLLKFAQTDVHWISDAIQPSHPLLPASPLALNLSQHQGLFQWVSSSHQVAKVLELQLQYQSFQWLFRVDFL